MEFTINNIQSGHTLQVTFKEILFKITGQILSPAGASLPAVTVTADNGGEQGLTDPNGYYQLAVGYNWTGTIIPEKQDYIFEPNAVNFENVVADTVGNCMGRHITDLFSDGIIDQYDLEIVCENWLATVPLSLDIDDDGVMNFKDFSIFSSYWQVEYGNFDLVTHSITASADSDGCSLFYSGRQFLPC